MKVIGKYFLTLQESHEEKLMLVCFPYAGGHAETFYSWVQWLPKNVSCYAIQNPGRSYRTSEASISVLTDQVSKLIEEFCEYFPNKSVPIVFFGHSLGALIAFETALNLIIERGNVPAKLIASACPSPDLIPVRKLSGLDDADFLLEISKLNGFPKKVLANEQLVKLFLPALRNDMRMYDGYQYRNQVLELTKITILYGTDDVLASETNVTKWQHMTKAASSIYQLPGDHFFINDKTSQIEKFVIDELNSVIEGV